MGRPEAVVIETWNQEIGPSIHGPIAYSGRADRCSPEDNTRSDRSAAPCAATGILSGLGARQFRDPSPSVSDVLGAGRRARAAC